MELTTTANPEHPEADMVLTRSLLYAVAQQRTPETIRVFRPGPTCAFGRLDELLPGFEPARAAAAAHGFTPVVRWGGGHAAAYDGDCVVVEIIRREKSVIGGLDERFADMVTLLQSALEPAGVTLELGELPGEYCPGRYSLHLPEGPKVAGVSQRVLAGASLTAAVLVLGGGERLRPALTDVYGALALALDPATVGAVAERHPNVTAELAHAALVRAAAARYGTPR